MVVKHAHRTPTTPPAYTASSTETRDLAITEYCSPNASTVSCEKAEARHSLAGQFPTVSLFKEYQDAAMAVSISFVWIIYVGSVIIYVVQIFMSSVLSVLCN